MQKSCSNCQWWQKVRQIKGICNRYDYGWVNSDYNCNGWQRIKTYKKVNYDKKFKNYD